MTHYLLGAVVRLFQRCFKGGIDKWERGRARSMAAASAPLHGEELPPEDLALVDAHHEIVVEWRTAEQPAVTPVRRRHLYRPPSPRQLAAMRARHLKPVQEFAADPLTAPLAGPLVPAVIAASVPVSPAPQPWFLESFTTGWTKAQLAEILAAQTEATR
jgi:hypothetical protein